jgi:hypothetical protein
LKTASRIAFSFLLRPLIPAASFLDYTPLPGNNNKFNFFMSASIYSEKVSEPDDKMLAHDLAYRKPKQQ